jgi:hypothetical protein
MELAKVNCISNTDPRIKVSVCWTDTDVTKTLFGETWTDGESKIICPQNYNSGGGNIGELWTIKNSPTSTWKIDLASYLYFGLFPQAFVRITDGSENFILSQRAGAFSNLSTNVNISTVGYTFGQITNIDGVSLNQTHFHQFTTNSGVTVKWEAIEGNAVGTDTWAGWKATTLSYVATTGNEACP